LELYAIMIRAITIGDGPLFNKIQRQAIENLSHITDTRENTRAQRALDLALEGAKLNVQV
jgi:hypothetical protein